MAPHSALYLPVGTEFQHITQFALPFYQIPFCHHVFSLCLSHSQPQLLFFLVLQILVSRKLFMVFLPFVISCQQPLPDFSRRLKRDLAHLPAPLLFVSQEDALDTGIFIMPDFLKEEKKTSIHFSQDNEILRFPGVILISNYESMPPNQLSNHMSLY